MISWFLKRIACFLRFLADTCDPTLEQRIANDRPFSETFDETKLPDYPKMRMKDLLALDELTPEQTEELAALASQFEGKVIFLDDPVGAEKEHL